MKRIIIDCLSSQIRTAYVEDGELKEIICEDKTEKPSSGDVYIGIVEKIMPGKFAFVNIGFEKNAFLYLNDKKQESLYETDLNGNSRLKIKQGQSIIVQIEKEETDIKGAYVNTNISFAGRYTVLISGQRGIGISKKISDEERRKKLKNIAGEIIPNDFALIMRTNCDTASDDKIKAELIELKKKADAIITKGSFVKPPALLYKGESECEKAIRDIKLNNDDEVIINDREIFERIIINKENNSISNNNIENIKYYDNDIPIFENYNVQSQLEKALHNKVWLKSGGFIIIDEAEACTVIDVNSGKCGVKSLAKMILKTNIEACEEIAKQMRLRNLSGMIMVDFIDMQSKEDNEKLVNAMKSAVKNDRVNVNVLSITELGILELTRKKTRKSLSEALQCSCPYCNGTGRVENFSFTADRIISRISSIFAQTIYDTVIISSSKNVINAVKGKNDEYKDIERKFNKKIKFNIIETYRQNHFEIEMKKENS